jgi:hypothetical protein
MEPVLLVAGSPSFDGWLSVHRATKCEICTHLPNSAPKFILDVLTARAPLLNILVGLHWQVTCKEKV